MDIPEDLHYTEEHEWIYVEDDIAIVGITDYAQSELGDVVFVELPQLTKIPMGMVGLLKSKFLIFQNWIIFSLPKNIAGC